MTYLLKMTKVVGTHQDDVARRGTSICSQRCHPNRGCTTPNSSTTRVESALWWILPAANRTTLYASRFKYWSTCSIAAPKAAKPIQAMELESYFKFRTSS